MISLSTRAKESIKTGLAMVVAIGISLRMGFENPFWAGFAVSMVSMDTAGQSLNKAALRSSGTLVGALAALAFIGLFPQQRWAMVLALTPFVGFCTYMLAGKKRQYFWFVTAFVCLLITIKGGPDSQNAFQVAVARLEEMALGILVYSLVSVFLWPRSSRSDLETASGALFDTQLQLYRAYRGLLAGQGRDEDSRPLRLREVQCLTQVGQALNAAETDSFEVWEVRHAWRSFLQHSTVLLETLGRWRVSLPEIRALDLARLLPGADVLLAELDRRFAQVEHMLAGQEAEEMPRAVELALDENQVRALSHFQRAALALFLTQLRKLDAVSRSLFDSVRDIKGSGKIASKPSRREPRAGILALDPDRLRSVFTVLASMWSAFLIWVYLNPPTHSLFVFFPTLFAMMSVLLRLTPSSLFPGFLLGIAISGVAYVGVMPHLSGYAELGLLLFCLTFGSFYLFWERQRRIMGISVLVVFLIVTGIANEQSYSFASFANTSAGLLLALALPAVISYVPSSPRPEKVFLRLLSRFFRHAEILMSRLAPERDWGKGFVGRWRSIWYRNDLLELPVKLAAWSERIDYRLLPGTTPEHVRALVTNLLSLTLRIKELVDARQHLRPDPRLEQVVEDLRNWRLLAQQQFRLWAVDPSAALDPDADMSERLTAGLARMEANIDEARAGQEGLRVDYEAFYRYLGGFRGLSEAAIGYAGLAAAVNWAPWQEARF